MKRVRTVLFWGHLVAGATAGIVILIMSLTGALLAFQPQILGWLERDVRWVAPSGARLSIDALVASALADRPGARFVSLTVDADPRASVGVNIGRDGLVYVDPYSGRVAGGGAQTARAFFQRATEWHRWLAQSGDGRQTARAITGASNVAFLLLALSGFYLWMPRRWSRRAARSIVWFQRTATARARDFNWHNVIGFWCAPAIIVMTATAIVMSYPWANRLVYQLAGTPLPQQQTRPGGGDNRADRDRPPSIDRALARAMEQMPTWASITVRPAAVAGSGPALLSLSVVDGAYWNPYARSTLTVAADGRIVRWEPYAAQTRGQKWRGWIRFAHTGELGGAIAQAVAGVACLGGVFLVWTGLSLALRRFAGWRISRRSRASAMAA